MRNKQKMEESSSTHNNLKGYILHVCLSKQWATLVKDLDTHDNFQQLKFCNNSRISSTNTPHAQSSDFRCWIILISLWERGPMIKVFVSSS